MQLRVLGVCVLVGASACSSSEAEKAGGRAEVASQEEPLVVAVGGTWGMTIPVCWNPLTTPNREPQKALVRRYAEQSWSRATSVKFVGWSTCNGSTDYANTLSIQGRPYNAPGAQGREGLSSIGHAASNWMGIDLDSPNLRAVTVHEFGHTLGFFHEQVDPATPYDCTAEGARSLPSGALVVGYWDSLSIMNYCNPWWASGALSRLDIIGARKYYGGGSYNLTGIDSVFADITGDGRADALVVNNDRIFVMPSTGSGFSGYRAATSMPFYGGMGTFFADVNGDGRADAIAPNAEGIAVLTSDGTNLTNYAYWTNAPFFGGRGTHFADVNGDGRADAIAVNDDGVYVMLSTGYSFTGYQKWSSGPFFGDRETFFVDVNGDHRADGVVVNDAGIGVILSTGTTFGAYSWWTSAPFYGAKATAFADVNGDGRADAIAVNWDNTYVMPSTGSAFTQYHAAGAAPFYGDGGTYFADYTGDGKADGIAVSQVIWGQSAWGSFAYGSFFNYPTQLTSGPFYPQN